MSNPYQPQDPYSKNPYGEQPAQTPPPGYGYPQQPPAPQDPYQQDPYGQQPPPYGYPQPGYPVQQQPGYGGYGGFTGENNGLAVGALVVGIVSLVGVCFLGWIIGVVAIGLGIGGLNRSKITGTGRGQSIAGIATGGAAVLFGIIVLVVLIANGSFNSTY